MSEYQSESNNNFIDQKSIPDLIIDGSIMIDSIDVFGTIIKQFPQHPALLKKYADLLFRHDLLDLAGKSYGEAAQLFIDTGNLLQALVSKKLQWMTKIPDKEEVKLFFASLQKGNFTQTPLRIFFDKLSPKELLAIISGFVRVQLAAKKTVKEVGDPEDDLCFIVSGTVKDSIYPSLETKQKVHRKPNIYLSENQVFGDIYPLSQKQKSASTVETVTQVELVKISRQKMKLLCRKYSNIEMAIIDLFDVRSGESKPSITQLVRQAERFELPIKMQLEIPYKGPEYPPLIIDGYSSDISIGGICVVLNGQSKNISNALATIGGIAKDKQIRISFPGETMELKVRGHIMWNHAIRFNGSKTLALGIKFEEDTPRLRGMLFMFANSLGVTPYVVPNK